MSWQIFQVLPSNTAIEVLISMILFFISKSLFIVSLFFTTFYTARCLLSFLRGDEFAFFFFLSEIYFILVTLSAWGLLLCSFVPSDAQDPATQVAHVLCPRHSPRTESGPPWWTAGQFR